MSSTVNGTSDVTQLTATLARLWAEALSIPEVASDGDFFALGGNSMLGVELTFLIAAQLGVKIRVKQLLDAPTPATMADAIIEGARLRAAAGG